MFQCIQLCRFQRTNMRNFVDVQNVFQKRNIKKLRDEELVFGEVLHREIHKRK